LYSTFYQTLVAIKEVS